MTLGLSPSEPWMEQAICPTTDPEAFFPEKGETSREAKRVCMGCPVRDDCLEFALRTDQRFGVFGGLSERERVRLKRGEPLAAIRARQPVVKQIPTKTCQQCGITFVRHGNAIYCTRACRNLAYGHTRQEFPKCVVCGTGYAASRSDAKYCSQRCQDRAVRVRARVITVTCQACGNDFEGDKRHRFCSQTCRKAGLRTYHRNYQRQKRVAS